MRTAPQAAAQATEVDEPTPISPVLQYRQSMHITTFPRHSTASGHRSFISYRTTASTSSYAAMRNFGEVLPVTVEAKSLSVWGGKDTSGQNVTAILKDVSLTVPAGQLLAILGGSGSGKTTLLNALAGRTDDARMAGEITYNGQSPSSYIGGGYVAYVQQQDFLLPCLTVRETLRYAARLRLPRGMSKAEKHRLVEAAITELGLRDCADTVIGDEWRKGVSGGERRRVSVAVQLLMNPSVILMDEPTTGLDAWTSHNLVRTLMNLCRKGRTIIMSIHQPRSTTFSLFHSIALLAKGDVIYSGPSGNVGSYFANIGLGIDKSVNPAEFLIDLTSVDTRDKEAEQRCKLRLQRLVCEWKFHQSKRMNESLSDDSTLQSSQISESDPSKALATPAISNRWIVHESGLASDAATPPRIIRSVSAAEYLISASNSPRLSPTAPFSYPPSVPAGPATPPSNDRRRSLPMLASSDSSCISSTPTIVRGGESRASSSDLSNSSQGQSLPRTAGVVKEEAIENSGDDVFCYEPAPAIRRITFFEEVGVLTHRAIVNLVRDRMLVVGTAIEAVIVGLISGFMFYQLDQTRGGIIGRQALLGTMSSAMNFLLMTFGCYKLTLDFRVFDRERKDKMYRVESFLLSSIFTNAILFVMHGALLAMVIYPMAGLRTDNLLLHFSTHLAGMVLMHLCTLVWSHLFVAITREFATAAGLLNLVCAFLCTSSGYLIPQTSIPRYLKWVNTVSYFSAGYRLLVSNEFSGRTFACPDLSPVNRIACEGHQILKDIGLDENDYYVPFVNFAGNIVTLTVLIIILLHIIVPAHGQQAENLPNRILKKVGRLFKGRASQVSTIAADHKSGEIKKSADTRIAIVSSLGDWEAVKVDVSVRNLSVSVSANNRLKALKTLAQCSGKKETKETEDSCHLLDGITSEFRAGELNVIMGASGAGKTTLLNALMARITDIGQSSRGRTTNMSGKILYGGLELQSSEVSALCSYVCQDDLHHLPALTARETLRYAALLRLPPTMSTKEKIARAEEVLMDLGLKDCGDIRVGDEIIKGLSGGEKRRLSIGVQTITNPKVLVLDEPTSGLDAFNSHMVMLTLKRIAQSGKTVICTIHQPRSDLVNLFDNLVLLARGGRLVYSGPMHKTLAYFENLGYVLPPHTNPADFFLDLSSVDLRNTHFETESRRRVDSLAAAWKKTAQFAKTLKFDVSQHCSSDAEATTCVGFAARKAQLTGTVDSTQSSSSASDSSKWRRSSSLPRWLAASGGGKREGRVWSRRRSLTSVPSDEGTVSCDTGADSEDDVATREVGKLERENSTGHVKFRSVVDVGVSGEIPMETHAIGQAELAMDSTTAHRLAAMRRGAGTTSRSSYDSFVDTMYTSFNGLQSNPGMTPPPRSKRGSVYLRSSEDEMKRIAAGLPPSPLPVLNETSCDEKEQEKEEGDPSATVERKKLQSGSGAMDDVIYAWEADEREERRKRMDLISRFVRERRKRSASNLTVAVPVLLSRMAKNISRQLPLVADRLGTVFGFAVIVSMYFYKLDLSEAKVQARLGILHQYTSLIFIAMMTNVSTFGKELALYRFDRADHAYSLESFLMAGMLTELPYQIFNSISVALIFMLLCGLQASLANFFILTFIAFAYLLTGESIGISFCALVRNSPFTVQVMSALVTVLTLLSGFLTVAPPIVLDRMNYASMVRYASHAIGIAEFRGTRVICPSTNGNATPFSNDTNSTNSTSSTPYQTDTSSVFEAVVPSTFAPLTASSVQALVSRTSALELPSPSPPSITLSVIDPSPSALIDDSQQVGSLIHKADELPSPSHSDSTTAVETSSRVVTVACRYRDGDDVLALLGFEGKMWEKLVITGILTVSYRFVAYIVLKIKVH